MDLPLISEDFSVLNIATTKISLKTRYVARFLILLLVFTSFFLPLQEIGSPHASVGSPLDGQKVNKLFTFLLLLVFHCICFLLFFFVCLCIYLSCHILIINTMTSVYFYLRSDEQNYCSVIFFFLSYIYDLEFDSVTSGYSEL